MLSREEARLRVFLDLKREYGHWKGPKEIVIVDKLTIERPWGWVFRYTSRGWLEGDRRFMLGGNAPYIVNRHDGSLRLTGTRWGIERYIEQYEAELAGSDVPPQVSNSRNALETLR